MQPSASLWACLLCRVLRWRVPEGAAFFQDAPLRVDSGVVQGDLVRAPACLPACLLFLLLLHVLLLLLLLLPALGTTAVPLCTPNTLPALQVGVNYDPMIAKVITRGPDRATALASLHTALQQLQVRCALRGLCLVPLPPLPPAVPALQVTNNQRVCAGRCLPNPIALAPSSAGQRPAHQH